jgi:hypothetical protein
VISSPVTTGGTAASTAEQDSNVTPFSILARGVTTCGNLEFRMTDKFLQNVNYHLDRSAALDFHYQQGLLWLSASIQGKHSTPIAYSAFEFRLALERIAFELLLRIEGGESPQALIEASRSFKRLEKKIYELGGHQRELDRKIAFSNILLRLSGASFQLGMIDVGTLSRLWHECSELCHINFTLAASASKHEFGAACYEVLSETEQYLRGASKSLIGWPRSQEPWFVKLEREYIEGTIDDGVVEAKLGAISVWGLYTAPDGTKTFFEDLDLRTL